MKPRDRGTCPPALIVRGRAWDIPEDMHRASVAGCREAAGVGRDVLTRGGSALDAVEAAMRGLEDDPTFDAGLGSLPNARGEAELDPMIMGHRDIST